MDLRCAASGSAPRLSHDVFCWGGGLGFYFYLFTFSFFWGGGGFGGLKV